MIKARRTLRTRIAFLGIICLLSGIAAVLLVSGSSRLNTVVKQEQELQTRQNQFEHHIGLIRRETGLLENDDQRANAARVRAELSEMSELWSRFLSEFESLLSSHSLFKGLVDEWQDISGTQNALETHLQNGSSTADIDFDWSEAATELRVFREDLDEIIDNTGEKLHLRRITAQWMIRGATFAVILSFLLAICLFGGIVSDIVSESHSPTDLQQEIDQCVQGNQFKSRIKLLLSPDQRDKLSGKWSTEITGGLRERRTHVCFELVARDNDIEISLWGRRYKWAGYIKSFQRIFFPAYAEATWRALSRMYNNDVSTAIPIARHRLKAGPFKAGYLILMEHVGEVNSVKEFLKSDFGLLPPDDQNKFLKHLIRFLHSLHQLGIYGAKPRYLHGKNLATAHEKRQFYLFDLDKVVIWESPPTSIAKWLRHKDYKRLASRIATLLDQERLEMVEQWLHGDYIDEKRSSSGNSETA